ncbi:universal stress protein [Treponema pectinovorum]|uniref:universal stress protein n=1 Tax=Treponema pectinovorum TaxID=164 RepID=UPI0011CC2724|nr:universal stress protein [Treponema pectinovorum]
MIKPLIQKIIVAVNGSDQSIRAAMYSILFAKQFNCTVKAVYVVDTAALKQLTMTKFFVKDESKKYEENLIKDGNKYLEYITTLAKEKGVKIETQLRRGTPWSEILRAGEEFGADTIFLGGRVHDSSQLSYTHDIASATNIEILANAKCNVLVVRQKEIEKLFKIG